MGHGDCLFDDLAAKVEELLDRTTEETGRNPTDRAQPQRDQNRTKPFSPLVSVNQRREDAFAFNSLAAVVRQSNPLRPVTSAGVARASGVLQTERNPLTPIGVICFGFAAMSRMFFNTMQPSKLMTRVRFPSPAPIFSNTSAIRVPPL
jgi:hypothetical protein